MLDKIGYGVLGLRTVRQRLQRPQAFGYFIIAENQRVLCAEFVRLAESLAKFLLDWRQLDAEARLAQIFRRAYGGRVSSFTHPGDVHVTAFLGWRFPAFLPRPCQPVFADGKADAFCWRPAKHFYQPAVEPPAAHGMFGTA